MINAAITPGTHPAKVNKNTIRTEPQPLSIIDSGGQKIQTKTLKKLICENFVQMSEKIMSYVKLLSI